MAKKTNFNNTPNEAVASEPSAGVDLIFSNQVEVVSHQFKLLPAEVIKRTGLAHTPDEDPESFTSYEHCHPYRTVDSDGKQHVRSSSIAGHFHLMEVTPGANGKAPTVKCVSGPMQIARKKVKGQMTIVDVPINDFDHHTHEVKYEKSHKILTRTENVNAVQYMAGQEYNKVTTLEGVTAAGPRS